MKNKMQFNYFPAAILLSIALLFQNLSCRKYPPVELEQELITTVTLTMKKTASSDSTIYTWQDLDGDGGNTPNRIDTLRFNDSSTYSVKTGFLNHSNGKNEDITLEVRAENKNHLLCFTPSSSNIIITITDSDGTYPVGLQSYWLTWAKGTGSILVRLRHQPGIKNGTCDPGETDVEVNFPYIID